MYPENLFNKYFTYSVIEFATSNSALVEIE